MDKNTAKSQVVQWLRSNPRSTLSEISEGVDIEPGQLGTIVGEMLRDGELQRGERYPFRYEVRK